MPGWLVAQHRSGMTKITSTRASTILKVGVVTAVAAALVAGALPAATAAEPVPSPPESVVEGLQDRADRIDAAGSPGAALALRDGGVTDAVAVGLADVDTGLISLTVSRQVVFVLLRNAAA